jgi:hypothetical protein
MGQWTEWGGLVLGEANDKYFSLNLDAKRRRRSMKTEDEGTVKKGFGKGYAGDMDLFAGVFKDRDEFFFKPIKLIIHPSYLPLQNLYLRVYHQSPPQTNNLYHEDV